MNKKIFTKKIRVKEFSVYLEKFFFIFKKRIDLLRANFHEKLNCIYAGFSFLANFYSLSLGLCLTAGSSFFPTVDSWKKQNDIMKKEGEGAEKGLTIINQGGMPADREPTQLDEELCEAIVAEEGLEDDGTEASQSEQQTNRRNKGQPSVENQARREKPKDSEQTEKSTSDGQEETEQVDMSGFRERLLGGVKELFSTIVSLMDNSKTDLNAFAKIIIRDASLQDQVSAYLRGNNTIVHQLTEQIVKLLAADACIENAERNMKILHDLSASLSDIIGKISRSNATAFDRTDKNELGQCIPEDAALNFMKVIDDIYGSVINNMLHAICPDEKKPGGMRVQRIDVNGAVRELFKSWMTGETTIPNEYFPKVDDLLELNVLGANVLEFVKLVNEVIYRKNGMREELETALDKTLGKERNEADKQGKPKERNARPKPDNTIDAIVVNTSTIPETCLFETIKELIKKETDSGIKTDLELLLGKLLRLKDQHESGYSGTKINFDTVRRAWEEIASSEGRQKHPPIALTHEAALRTIERYRNHSSIGDLFQKGLLLLKILYEASENDNFVIPLDSLVIETAEALALNIDSYPKTFNEFLDKICYGNPEAVRYLSELGLNKEKILNQIALYHQMVTHLKPILLEDEEARRTLYNEVAMILAGSAEREQAGLNLEDKICASQRVHDEFRSLVDLVNATTARYGYTVPEMRKILEEIAVRLEESCTDGTVSKTEVLNEIAEFRKKLAEVLPLVGVGPTDLLYNSLLSSRGKLEVDPAATFEDHLIKIGAQTASQIFGHVNFLTKMVGCPLDDGEFSRQEIKKISSALRLYHQLISTDGPISEDELKELQKQLGSKNLFEKIADEMGFEEERSCKDSLLSLAEKVEIWLDRMVLAEQFVCYTTNGEIPSSLVPSIKVDLYYSLSCLFASTLSDENIQAANAMLDGNFSGLASLGEELLNYLKWLEATKAMSPLFNIKTELARFIDSKAQDHRSLPQIPKEFQVCELHTEDILALFLTALKSSQAERAQLFEQLKRKIEDNPKDPAASFLKFYLAERKAAQPKVVLIQESEVRKSDKEPISSPSPLLPPDGETEDEKPVALDTNKFIKLLKNRVGGFVRKRPVTKKDIVKIIKTVGSTSAAVGKGGLVGGTILAGGSLAAVVLGCFELSKFIIRTVFGKIRGSDSSDGKNSSIRSRHSGKKSRWLSLKQIFSNDLLNQQTFGTSDPKEVRRKMEALKKEARSFGLKLGLFESAGSLIARIEKQKKTNADEATRAANLQKFQDDAARRAAKNAAKQAATDAAFAENQRKFEEKAAKKKLQNEERQRQQKEKQKAKQAARKAPKEKPEGESPGLSVGQVVSRVGKGLGKVLHSAAKQALRGAGDVAKMTGNLTNAAVSSMQAPAQPSPAPVQPSKSTRQSPSSASRDEPLYVDDGSLTETSGKRSSTRPSEQTTQKGGKARPAQTQRENENAEEVETGPITYGDIDIEGERPSGLPGLHAHGSSYVAPSIEHPPAPIHIREAVEAVLRIGEELTQSDPASAPTLQGVANAVLRICEEKATAEDIGTVNDFLTQHGQGPIDTSTSISDSPVKNDPDEEKE